MRVEKRTENNRTFKIIIAVVVFFVLAVALGLFSYNYMLSPNYKKTQEVNFLVNPNDNLTTITANLEEQDIVKSAVFLKLHGKISNVEDFVEGPFTVDKSWDAKRILEHLTVEANVIPNETTVTFQEGLWAKEIAEKLELNLDVTAKELLELWNDEKYIKSLMRTYPFLTDDILNDDLTVKLEGYLAPDTYNFFIDTDIDTITKTLLNQSLVIFNKYEDLFDASDYSIHEIYSLAALTQYESGKVEDDPIIAGIWYNRLEKEMRLESSVTVCYALYEFDNWEECETNTDIESPYNTYQNAGIPPGPVTNPGENSILATLDPQETDYYFFLADVKGDGTVHYSETFEEHQKKVNKYLR